jgi:hypothetical protein
MSIAHTSRTFGSPRIDIPGVAGSADANVGSASEQVSSPVPPRSAASMAIAQQLPQTETHAPTTFSTPSPLKPTLGSFPPTASLETMPVELLQMIVETLDANDLASLRKANGALYKGLSDPVLLSKKMTDAIPTLTHPQALNQLLAEVARLPSSISQKLVPLLGEQIEAVLLNFRAANYVGDRTEMEPVIKQFFEKAYNHAPLDGGELMAKAIPMFNSLPTLTQPKALEQLLTAMERLPSSIRQKLLPVISNQIANVLEGFLDVENLDTRNKAMTDMKPVIKKFFDQACDHAPFDGGAHMAKAIAMNDTLRNERAGKLSSLTKLEPLFAKREAMIHSGMTLDAPQWTGLRNILLERIMYFNNPSSVGSTKPAIQRFIYANNRVG